jgi:triosephosphate isomerase
MSEWASYLAQGTAPYGRARKFIGGNWKCNGTVAQVQSLTSMLNKAGQFPLTSEVVIAVPSIHLLNAKSLYRRDVAVAAQVS